MAERFVSVSVQAPIHQVYTLFTHFNDFPKFMRFVKEVTYYDNERSHWVAQIAGHHEWDAINEGWIEDRQVGWRSINGLTNAGKVTFMETGPNLTQVTLFLHFQPPGVVGKLGEFLVGDNLERELEEDLQRFAHMVVEAPPGTLDPMSSHFLFHEESAVATGTTTAKQNSSMADDPMMTSQELEERRNRLDQEKKASERAEMEHETATKHEAALLEQSRREQESALKHQARLNREEEQRRQVQSASETHIAHANTDQQDPTLDSLGGRGAATTETPLGDRDASNERFPDYQRGPDSTSPKKALETSTEIEKTDSPWRRAIRGEETPVEKEDASSQE